MEAREDSLVSLLATDAKLDPVVLTRHHEGIDE
ncbi:MAG: rRNA maturation RNase YbeY, partial [Atopobium sp.]|nr:rRNA maturation RNase YbeY [Atopobium sp.]